MPILDDVLASLKDDAPVRDVSVCIRTTAVWSRELGLAYTFPRERHSHDRRGARPPKRLSEMTARELAQLAASKDLTEASVGIAAINSLLDVNACKLRKANAYDLIVERAGGGKVTVVGHFPFVEKLAPLVDKLWVLERNPRAGDLPAEEASRVIPQSDVVAITGTALINGTLDELLRLARDRFTLVLGPSTVQSPALFDYGVDAVCGSLVTDPDRALRCVREGSSFRYMEGIEPVIMRP